MLGKECTVGNTAAGICYIQTLPILHTSPSRQMYPHPSLKPPPTLEAWHPRVQLLCYQAC